MWHPYACFVNFFAVFEKIFYSNHSIISAVVCKYQNINSFKKIRTPCFSKRSGAFSEEADLHKKTPMALILQGSRADTWKEEQRGFHRARSAGAKENSLSKLKLF